MDAGRMIVPAYAFVIMVAVTVAVATVGGGRFLEARELSSQALRAGVDLVTIDVQITPSKDAPLRDFVPSDFDINISGRKRPAVSATLLHADDGAIARDPPRTGAPPDCVFGFHRKTDRTTVHYLVGVAAIEADRKQVKKVEVKLVDTAFTVQWYAWRSPIRRLAATITPLPYRDGRARVPQNRGPQSCARRFS